MTRRESFPPVIDAATFERQIRERGWVRFPGVLGKARLQALREDVDRVYALRRVVQEANGVAAGMQGVAHHVLGEGTSLDAFVADLPLWETIEAYFGGRFILLNFGAALHPPGGQSYTLKPHRDVRAFSPGYRLSLNMLVMLDDFTEQNGATLMLSGSQHVETMPTMDDFSSRAERARGQAGDIVLFDSLLVHAAAPNSSDAMRRALTLCFGRPFMKPQMDWPRFLAPTKAEDFSPKARQLLGYDARVPASLDEYYQPPERWTFKPDQR
jgi:ectoine hydroxylase-related dioxygenase (phytanoyl-CoA dioxygenase family)